MKKTNCIILEDEYLARMKLLQFVEQLPELHLLGAFATVFEATQSNTIEQCDLFFLDINLPDANGLEFAKSISKQSIVIFTTAYSEFAVEGFNLNAADYLLKPIVFERFEVAIQKAKNQRFLLQGNENFILLKQGRELIRCNLDEVYYIKGMQEYLYWKTVSGKIISLGSLAAYANDLEVYQFMRIHKSYLVNLDKIDSVSTKSVKVNNEEIPIGASFAKEFRDYYTKIYMK